MEIKARAPGKIILAGEHAVVHGSTAVAASFDLFTLCSLRFHSDSGEAYMNWVDLGLLEMVIGRYPFYIMGRWVCYERFLLWMGVFVELAYNGENDDTLNLSLKSVGLEFSWSVGRIREALSHLGGPFLSTPTSCSTEAVRCIAALVEEQNFPEAKIGLATGVSAFLWLYTSIQGFKPATVVVTSDLPVGAGLGSSAAFCVSLTATLLAYSDSVSLDKNQQGWLAYGDSDLDLLNKWAFEGEKIIHGKPSGLDNTVSTYGM
ncbi:hypothetical protein Patl1_22674 [Pistacia atlantica]|uniref:Uncharacterized protein n=1 Tax=Pistacia atlantica TaxID=434234 RepID=A0ACC1A2X3_9ROSI|nr:hypothetical protein Patl1_22674 [Pistacia atlantica]